jgi:methylated-DNA-protein-cysteine methyltransferase related protein
VAPTMPGFRTRVLAAVREVPAGRVASYGAIAGRAGQPRAARAVGQALRSLGDDSNLPWWRVLSADGTIPRRADGGAVSVQRALLEAEGVRFDRDGRISWVRDGWTGGDEEVR